MKGGRRGDGRGGGGGGEIKFAAVITTSA